MCRAVPCCAVLCRAMCHARIPESVRTRVRACGCACLGPCVYALMHPVHASSTRVVRCSLTASRVRDRPCRGYRRAKHDKTCSYRAHAIAVSLAVAVALVSSRLVSSRLVSSRLVCVVLHRVLSRRVSSCSAVWCRLASHMRVRVHACARARVRVCACLNDHMPVLLVLPRHEEMCDVAGMCACASMLKCVRNAPLCMCVARFAHRLQLR